MTTPLHDEIAALRAIRANDHGLTLFGCAFGSAPDELSPVGGAQYPFYIELADQAQLRLILDGYSALGLPSGSDAFDDERWHAMTMTFAAPATRRGYRYLAQVARILVSGNAVHMGDGYRVKLAWLLANPKQAEPWYLEEA
ncbi:hypothetical protein [Acidovorax sp. SUPP3334]|uniref:hypothetical protein n=1 Tax=Acidovorax sp. SUPP3334 TaxID=2920881 RepID=UPI0023DE34DF|nr:hypothetical protein [Acidovorax sp. SUPP3334]GKT21700.1 hypothetical protein AVHM3334_05700 [Acidovorax sp. SUPP3334]